MGGSASDVTRSIMEHPVHIANAAEMFQSQGIYYYVYLYYKYINPIQETYKHANSYMAKVHITPEEKRKNYEDVQRYSMMSFNCWEVKNIRGKNNCPSLIVNNSSN